MYIEELNQYGIPSYFLDKLNSLGYIKLYPPQEKAVKNGLLNGKNMVICTPTSSGKTLIGIFSAILHLLKGNKVLYICPLRSIASEKYEEISNMLYDKYKVALSIGDYDSSDPWLENYDFIISTYEKADSLLRHKASWLNDVSLFIIDEIHMINSNRGPTLEFLIARLKKLRSGSNFLALSATIKNVQEVAQWLSAEFIIDNWRPVPLKEGVYKKGIIRYKDDSVEKIQEVSGVGYIDLAMDIIEKGGQALVFNSSRTSSVRVANRLQQFVSKYLNSEEKDVLKKIASKIEDSDRSSQNLKELIQSGVAFHHAGLSYNTRKFIEDAFRNRYIKVISSTTTLGAGVNVPARRVIINEISRYEPDLGYSLTLSVNEYKQLAGRAGRPKYDNVGEAIIIAKGGYDVDYLMNNYIYADYEAVESQITNEKSLRSHVLTIIANNVANDKHELEEILSLTFAGNKFGTKILMNLSNKIIDFLSKENFIIFKKDNFVATQIGKRISELYIDPVSASLIIKGLNYYSKKYVRNLDFASLFLICNTEDAQTLNVNKFELDQLYDELQSYLENDTLYPTLEYSYDDEDILSKYKAARVLYDWINEVRDDFIADKYSIGLGDLYNLVQTSKWLCYSASELARILKHTDLANHLSKLTLRLASGVKEELIELVQIPGIGRYKARVLYNAGYKNFKSLKEAKEDELLKIPGIGHETVKQIKKFLSTL